MLRYLITQWREWQAARHYIRERRRARLATLPTTDYTNRVP